VPQVAAYPGGMMTLLPTRDDLHQSAVGKPLFNQQDRGIVRKYRASR
jgi:hypothetical protein